MTPFRNTNVSGCGGKGVRVGVLVGVAVEVAVGEDVNVAVGEGVRVGFALATGT